MPNDPMNKMGNVDINAKLDKMLSASAIKVQNLEKQRIAAAEREQQQAELARSNESSWSNKLGLEEGSFLGNRVNDAASLVSGTTRLLGNVASLPVTGLGMAMTAPVTEEDYQANNRVKAGTATAEDIARLNRVIDNGGKETIASRISDAEKLRGFARKITGALDTTSIVNQTNRDALSNDLGADFENQWGRVTSGWKDGKPSEVVAGLGNLFANAGAAVWDNPSAAREYIIENAPQLLIGGLGAAGKAGMMASNLGYAADYYQQGIQEFAAKNNGQLPSQEQRNRMSLLAASLALAETGGDVAGLAAGKLLGRSAKGLDEAAKASFKKSMLGTAGATLNAGAVEAATEGYQTWAEGEVIGKPVTAKDVYVGATIGGVAGAGLGGGARAVSEIMQPKAPKEVKDAPITPEQKDLFNKAVETGDPAPFLDKTKNTYDPSKALGVLFQHSQLETSTPEVKQANLVKATKIIDDLEAERETIEQSLAVGTSAAKEEAKANIEYIKSEIAQTSAEDTNRMTALQSLLETFTEDLNAPVVATNEEKALTKRLNTINNYLNSARNVRDEIGNLVDQTRNDDVEVLTTQLEDTNTEVSSKAAERIITLSMTNPEKIDTKTAKRILQNENNGLSTEQRAAFREFTEARIAENRLRTIGGVSEEIALGTLKGKRTGNIGIAQYRERVATAIKAENKGAAERSLKLLDAFAKDHAQKAQKVAEALQMGLGHQVVKQGKLWRILPRNERKSDSWMAKNGGVTVNSPKLVDSIQMEAKTIAQTHQQLSNAVAQKFVGTGEKVRVDSEPSDLSNPPSQNISSKKMEEDKARLNYTNLENAGKSTKSESDNKVDEQVNTEVQPTSSSNNVSETQSEPSGLIVADAPQAPVPQSSSDTTSTSEQAKAKQQDEAQAKSPVAEDEAAQEESKPALTVFSKPDNYIAKHLTQANKSESATARPLATTNNFISALRAKTTSISQYLSEGAALTSNQKLLVKHFVNTAESWFDTIKSIVVKRPDSESKYFYNDVMQYLINEDGDLDENVKTAISYAAYTAVAEMANGPAFNDRADINRILGLDKDSLVDPEAWKVFRNAGALESITRNSMGQSAIAALGFKAGQNTPINLIPQLEAAMGAYIVEMLVKEGLVERYSVPRAVFNKFASNTKQTEEYIDDDTGLDNAAEAKGDISFIRPIRNSKEVTAKARTIGDMMKDTQSILDKLFGAESGIREPSLSPTKYNQKTVANGRMNVPSDLKKALQHQQNQAYKINPAMHGLVSMLTPERVLKVMGYKEADTSLQKSMRMGQEAKNDSLVRELERYKGYVQNVIEPIGLDQGIYFQHDAWKNQRVGIKTNMINPQASKFQRHMMYKDGTETTVNINDVQQFNNFKLRVGEGLGVKVDKQSNEVSLKDFDKKINQPQVVAAITALNKFMQGEELTDADQDAIIKGVSTGGENTHTLSALVAWAQYEFAKANNKTEFTVQLAGEVDGVTNGPMLTHALMGAAPTVDDLFKFLNRGGFFEEGNPNTQYNIWRGVAGHLDLYETTTKNVMRQLGELIKKGDINQQILNAVYTFTGILEDAAGNITKDGRNIIKTPLTALVFGSGVGRSVESMAETFVEGIYDQIQKLHDGNSKAPTREAIIKSLRDMGINVTPDTTIEQLMEIEFTNNDVETLKAAFTDTIGEATKQAIKIHFESFLKTRDTFNKTAQMAYNLYDRAYNAARKEFIKELIANGEMEVNGVGDPIHDLTKAQEAQLDKRLAKAMPILHTAMSSMNDELDAGLYMVSKSDRRMSMDQPYSNEVRLNRDGAKTSITHGFARNRQGPGVAMFSASTHSSDSAIAHKAVRMVNALNVHDALATGVGTVIEAGKQMNKATWEILLNYSPANEVFNALLRSIDGVTDFIKNDPAGEQAKEAIKELMEQEAEKLELAPNEVLRTTVVDAKMLAIHADSIRLGLLSKMNVVSQYAIEGGSYEVSPEERAEAAKRLEALDTTFSEQQVKEIEELISLVSSETNNVPQQTNTDAPVLLLNNAQAMQLLNAGKANEALSKGMRNQMTQVYGAMTKDKLNLAEAIKKALSPVNASNMVQYLNEQYLTIDPNAWGEVGSPTINSNPELLKMFASQPDMTGGALIKRLKAMMKKDAKANQVNMVLLEQIEKAISPKLRVKFVTPTTPASEVLAKGADRSRGWYASNGGAEAIYILSPDYKHSGLTVELLMHELTHAALVHATVDAQGDAKALVDDLETLRKAAIEFDTNGKWSDATVDVNELLAWGLNNREFQREVLSKIQVKSKSWGNKLVQGMSGFLKTIVNFLFKDANNRRKEIAENGMAVLIANASGLFNQAAQVKSSVDAVQSMTNPVDQVAGLSTTELYKSLINTNGNSVSTEFDSHLQNVLNKIVEKLHGPFGTFKAELMQNQDLSGREILAEAITSGQAPFAAQSLAIGMTEQEAYVAEQIEATVAAALNDGASQVSVVHRELVKLYQEMQDVIKPEHFYKGDWNAATVDEKQEATELHDFLFKIEMGNNGRSDYLARFVAVSLGNETVNNALKVATKVITNAPATDFSTRLMNWFERALAFISGRLTNTFAGQQANAKLESLVQQLVDIEAKRRRTLTQQNSKLDPAMDMITNASQKVKDKVAEFGRSEFFKESKNSFVRAAGSVTTVLASDRLDVFGDLMLKVRNEEFTGRQGVFAGIINEIKGANESNIVFHYLLRAAKKIEGIRKDIMTGTNKLVLESFANKGVNITHEQKQAISAGLLRTDMSALLNHYSMNELNKLVQVPAALNKAIANYENQLVNNKYRHFYMKQTKLLAYYMATGDIRDDLVLMNANNIARMYETPFAARVTEQEVATVEAIIDPLVSLYALSYTREEHMVELRKLFKIESERTDGGNGLELTLKMHKQLQQDSKERLFDGTEALFVKGYTPEIYNPYKSIVVANNEDGAQLVKEGWVKGEVVQIDENDINNEERHIYSLRDGGLPRRVSGTISTTGMNSKGSKAIKGSMNPNTDEGMETITELDSIRSAKQRTIRKMFNADPDFNPAEANQDKAFMAPILNPKGEVVNYRYLMKHRTKDRLLDRDNRFEYLLGTMAGSIYDKQQTKQQNRKVIEALYDQYKAEYGINPKAYVSIGPTVADKEMREIYNLLPDDTKKVIRELFGKDEMKVRTDLLDINFGYRKLSWADGFEKDAAERTVLNTVMMDVAQYMFKDKAQLRLRQGEQVWQSVVQMTKDNMVVKSFSTLMGNFKSNISELLWFGVSPMDIIKHHRVALKAALDYRRDSGELFELNEKLKLDYLVDRAKMERRVIQLNDAIARNPVKPLIDAGLMPTIVEDVDMEEDIYSYKSAFVNKTNELASHLNKNVVNTGKWLLMTQDTPLYKVMSHGTQLSDFVARYTLYQHLTTSAKNKVDPLEAEQIVSEAFVNYDIPSHRKLQALNDNGIVWFTKYYLRIQKVIMRLMRDNPGRSLAMVGLSNYFTTVPTLMDSSMVNRLNNPLSVGALKYPSTLDDLATVKMLMSPFK